MTEIPNQEVQLAIEGCPNRERGGRELFKAPAPTRPGATGSGRTGIARPAAVGAGGSGDAGKPRALVAAELRGPLPGEMTRARDQRGHAEGLEALARLREQRGGLRGVAPGVSERGLR